MKKIFSFKKLSLISVLALALISTSCGASAPSSTPTNSAATASVAATKSDAKPSSAAPSSSPATQSETSSTPAKNITITIGATSVPHAEILNQIVPDLQAQGITLNIKEFSDYTLLNPSLANSSLDANYFQHVPYLTDYNTKNKTNLVSVGPVHLEPLGLYSKKITSLDQITDGSQIGIPNDATNETRALKLLQDNKLITLDPSKTSDITVLDIKDNPKKLKIKELDASMLPKTVGDLTAAVINTNFALDAGFTPSKDALAIESATNNPYANVLVVRSGDENKPEIQALYKALTSDKVKKFIEDKYKGAVIPAF